VKAFAYKMAESRLFPWREWQIGRCHLANIVPLAPWPAPSLPTRRFSAHTEQLLRLKIYLVRTWFVLIQESDKKEGYISLTARLLPLDLHPHAPIRRFSARNEQLLVSKYIETKIRGFVKSESGFGYNIDWLFHWDEYWAHSARVISILSLNFVFMLNRYPVRKD